MLLLAFSILLAGGLAGGAPVDAQEDMAHLVVEPEVGHVGGRGWLPGATATVTIGDLADSVETVTAPVEDGGWFGVAVDAELPPGTLVTVSDGETTKDHVVAHLTLHGDPETSVASGEARPGTTVNVRLWEWPDGPGGPSTVFEADVVADDQGAWVVDLAAAGIELNESHEIFAAVFDDDGDSTLVGWAAFEEWTGQIKVYPELDEVGGGGFAIHSEVDITIDAAFAASAQTDVFGNFEVVIDQDLRPGQLVTVTDGVLTRQHLILPLTILNVDVHRDTVSGVGEPLTHVTVTHEPERDDLVAWRNTTTAADGTWSVDFSEAVSDHPLDAALDIQPGMQMTASQSDDDGDSTVVVVGAFPDVSADNVHAANIGRVAYHQIALGYTDGTYRPATNVRRDQMASFVVRTLEAAGHTLPTPEHAFTDIGGNTHEQAIGQLAAADIVRGRTPTSYAPDRTVTRDQMASYLIRALEWAQDTTYTAPKSPFTDIAGNTHEQAIDLAYELGLTTGRTETTYAPRSDVRRDQMASFLVRLLPELLPAET